MTMQRSYKAIFFDLDGTLLPIDTTAFMASFFKSLGVYFLKHGFDAASAVKALGFSTKYVMEHTDERTNWERFWQTYITKDSHTREQSEAMFTKYYATTFDSLGDMVVAHPEARKALKILREKHYRLALTTMPLFPRIAVNIRLKWAGLTPDYFEYITDMNNSYSTKPHLEYYQQTLDILGLDPHDVLMVGNNTLEDGAAAKLGCDLYLITNNLISARGGVDINTVKHGTLAEFVEFCRALPPCQVSSIS